jgi:hypothetical protein
LDEDLPRNIVYLCASVLIWIFGVLVFLPLAEEIDPEGLSILVALLIFSAFSLFLIKGFGGLGQALDVASSILAEKYRRRSGGGVEGVEETRKRMRIALEVGTLAIVYLLYSPLLSRFHPSINGVALIVTVLGVLWTLRKRV